jgi:hypothetical protein
MQVREHRPTAGAGLRIAAMAGYPRLGGDKADERGGAPPSTAIAARDPSPCTTTPARVAEQRVKHHVSRGTDDRCGMVIIRRVRS